MNISLVGAVLLGTLALSGCDQEGPAQKAGKHIDNAMGDVGSAVQNAGDKIKDASH